LYPQQEVGFISFSGGEPFIVDYPTPPPGVVGGGVTSTRRVWGHLDINFAMRVLWEFAYFDPNFSPYVLIALSIVLIASCKLLHSLNLTHLLGSSLLYVSKNS